MPPVRDPLAAALAALELSPARPAPASSTEPDTLHLGLFDLPADPTDEPEHLAAIDALQWLCAEIPVTRWTAEAREMVIDAVRLTCTERLPGLPMLTPGAGGRAPWGTVSGGVWGSLVRLQRAVDARPGAFGADAHQLVAAIADGVWIPCNRYTPRGTELLWAWRRVRPQWRQNRTEVRSWPRSRWAIAADLAAGWFEADPR